MQLQRYITRFWYYFRTGYSTYLTFMLAAVNTLTIVFYILIDHVPFLKAIFPKFSIFAITAIAIGVPLAVFIGWMHIKGTLAFSSEMDISIEANPYAYKLPPGWQKEVTIPFFLQVLRLTKKLLKHNKLLTPEEEAEIRELEDKVKLLIKGGYVGIPRRRAKL